MEQAVGQFFRNNVIVIVLFFAGVLLIGFGVYQMTDRKNQQNVVVTGSKPAVSQTPKKIISLVYVDIEGGVVKPGVYQIPRESRIKDLLDKAGGLSGDADSDLVAKIINLAQKITDGEKIYIPRIADRGSEGAGSAQENRMNINSAAAADLETLPGIGVVSAGKIISGRSYQSLDELVSKKILTQTAFDKVKDKIVVY